MVVLLTTMVTPGMGDLSSDDVTTPDMTRVCASTPCSPAIKRKARTMVNFLIMDDFG
jgi:hypothetical protein